MDMLSLRKSVGNCQPMSQLLMICKNEIMILMRSTRYIVSIPKEEIKISPDIQFYDVEQSKLNILRRRLQQN
jgi:hypothetical protein